MQSALNLLQRCTCSLSLAHDGAEMCGPLLQSQGSSLTGTRGEEPPAGDVPVPRFKATMSEILVVDDEPLIAMMLADWLEDEGHGVVGPAHSIEQASEIISTTPISAAILDVSLGEQQSFALAAELQERNIPFAFATGHSVGSVPAEFRHVATISKPFDFDVVRRIVADLNAHVERR